MADIFGISVSALQAFKNALDVTGNNIANASTPGYDKESAILSEALPQANGTATVGSGVVISGVARAFSQAATNQLNSSQSALGKLNSLQAYSTQIDNLFGTTAGGVSTALQSYYGAWSNVANNPTSTASRQALLSAAQRLAGTLQSNGAQLNALNSDVNARISTDVQQINSLASSVATLNKQIVVSTGQAGGQPPNALLDQRDQAVSKLSQLVNVTTTTDSSGALNVFVGTGQSLVLADVSTPLTTVPDQYNASQLNVSTSAAAGNVINNTLTSGDLGGLLAARTQVINPALNQLGQIATAVSRTANAQQSAGIDLNGQAGAALFSVSSPQAFASSKNSDTTTATVSITDLGTLTSNDYVLSYQGGAYALTRSSDGSSVPLTGAGTVASPLTADGIAIVLSGTPANGDTFLVQPTAQIATSLTATLADPSKVAAAGALVSAATLTNAGNGTVTQPVVLDPTNVNVATPATIQFTNATTYSINGAGSFTYAPGGNVAANGWQVQISGTPYAGDTFTVKANSGGSGDNRNALASAGQQTSGVLANGTISIGGAISGLVTGLGSQAQEINTAQTAQAAINTNAQSAVQSTSGVNLDEEGAKLLQWQQAYQAAAQALVIGNSLFTTLINSVNGR